MERECLGGPRDSLSQSSTLDLLQAWVAARVSQSGAPATETLPQTVPSRPSQGERHCIGGNDELDFNRALELLAERALEITCAQGAAIALGQERGMVCRANARLAPVIGAPLFPDGGLSGLCLRTRKVIVCQDTGSDPNVNIVACQELNVRSLVIFPILTAGQELGGVLEVFSSRPGAFPPQHVERLAKLTELIGSLLDKTPAQDAVLFQPTPEPVRQPLHTINTRSRSEAAAPDGPHSSEPVANMTPPDPAPPVQLCDVCGYENQPYVTVCEKCDVPLPSALKLARADFMPGYSLR